MQAQEEVVMIRRKRSGSKRPRLALTMATTSSSGATSDVFSGSSDRLSPSSSYSGDRPVDELEEDMANCLILLARGSSHPAAAAPAAETYPCKTCNKSFPSFQALGGHRASHKRLHNNKPATTTTTLTVDDKKLDFQPNGHDDSSINIINSHQVQNKSRVHECSICGAEFASGQALGGHMRRHRPIPPTRGVTQDTKRPRNVLSLDLNLPAPEDDRAETNKFPFAPKEQVMIFSASPLVDCQY